MSKDSRSVVALSAQHATDGADGRAGAAGAWRVFVVAGVAVALTQVGVSLTAAALPLYLLDLGASEGRIGLEVGVGSLAAVLGMLALGPALNRRGPRPFLALGAALCLASALAMWAVPNEGAVTGLRVLQGVGAAIIVPSVAVLVVGLYPARPATVLGLVYSLNSLSLACGPPLGLILYDAHGAAGLLLPSAALSALGLAAVAWLPRGQATRGARGFGVERVWLPLYLASACSVVYYGGALAYLALALRDAGGPNAGLFFAADSLGSFVLRAVSGPVVDRVGSSWPKLLGGAAIVPGVLLLAAAPSPWTLALAGVLTGSGAGLFLSTIMADLARLSEPRNRGTALALGAASLSAGAFAGSAASGLAFDARGFDAVVAFSAVATLAALPFAFGPLRRRHVARGV